MKRILSILLIIIFLSTTAAAIETTWRHSGFEVAGYDINFTWHNITKIYDINNVNFTDFYNNRMANPATADLDMGSYNITEVEKINTVNFNDFYDSTGYIKDSILPNYIIRKEGLNFVALNTTSLIIEQNESDVGLVINNTIKNMTNGGFVYMKGDGTHWSLSTTIVIPYNNIQLSGAGYNTILDPDKNIPTIELKAPVSFTILSNFAIIDNNESTSLYTTAIYLNDSGNNSQIHDALIENINMWYVGNGITNSLKTSDIVNSVFGIIVRNVKIDSYRGIGIRLTNTFDSVFDVLFLAQKNTSSNHGIYIYNTGASGNQLSHIKVLGAIGSTATGLYLSDIDDVLISDVHIDTMGTGVLFTGRVDRVACTNLQVNAGSNHGIQFFHSSGNISVANIVSHLNIGYGIFYGVQGGLTNIIGGYSKSNIAGDINVPGTKDFYQQIIGVSPFNFGKQTSAPIALGTGDTYYNQSKGAQCLYVANWVFIENSSGVC